MNHVCLCVCVDYKKNQIIIENTCSVNLKFKLKFNSKNKVHVVGG